VVGATLVVGAVVVAAFVVAVVVAVAAVVGVGVAARLLLHAATRRIAAAQRTMLRRLIMRESCQRMRTLAGSGDVLGLTDADPARYRCGALSRK
jgi:hypothetical protein